MSYDPKNYPKSQKDAFENELKDHFDAIDTWILTHTDAKGVQYFVEG